MFAARKWLRAIGLSSPPRPGRTNSPASSSPPAHSTKGKYRPHIDGLRAIAVLLVVGFHAFPRTLMGGFIGVDIFFVISGFLITGILYTDFSAPGRNGVAVIMDFYGRRVRRIFPALLVVLVACSIIGYQMLLPDELKKLSGRILAGVGFYSNIQLAGETGYFADEAIANPLLHLWSLGIEEQFYLVWPLLIWVAARCRIRLLPFAVFFGALSFFWNDQKSAETVIPAFFLPQTRLWELWIGAVCAAISHSMHEAKGSGISVPAEFGATARSRTTENIATLCANLVPLLGLGMIVASLLPFTQKGDFPNRWTLLPTVGAALVLCSRTSAWINRGILSQRFLVWIGLISYPLYLWHWPLLSFAQTTLGESLSPAVGAAAVAVSGVLAWLTFRFIERPIRNSHSSSFKTLGLITGMAALALFSFTTHRSDGFPGRFPPFLQRISSYKYDYSGLWRQRTYFLVEEQTAEEFAHDPAEINPSKPTIYLWGDSHAAALYPGLRSRFGVKYNIAQRTAAAIPPLLGIEIPNRDQGRAINQHVFDSIKGDRPERVILEANWAAYDWKGVARTISELKAAGIHHITIIGPVPQWTGGLPQQLYNNFRRHHTDHLPRRLNVGVSAEPMRVDRLMAEFCKGLGVEYISPHKILGNTDGFITLVGDSEDSLVTFDYGHLTEAGSIYLVSRFPIN